MRISIRKDERGTGHVAVAILAVVIIAAIGFVGWRVMNKNNTAATNTSTPAAVVSNATETACNKVYNDKNLCKFASSAADFAKLPYTAVDTSVDAQGQTSSVTIQSDGKSNFSMTAGSGATAYSTVEIGSTVYVKSGTSTTWTKYTSNAPAVTNPATTIKPDFSTSTTPAAQQIQYKKLGTEACGKLTCLKYQIIDPASAGTTQYAWFDTTSYRLQRWSSKTSDGSTNDFSITYSAVKISAPTPVTAAPTATSTTGLTPAEAQALQQAQSGAQ